MIRQTMLGAVLLLCFILPSYSQSGGERKVLSYRVDVQQGRNSPAGTKLSGLIVLSFDRDATESANLDSVMGVTPSSGHGDWMDKNFVSWTPGIKDCDLKIKTVSIASKDGTILTRTATFTLNRSAGGYQGEFVATYKDDEDRTVLQEQGPVTLKLIPVDVRK